MAQTRKTRMNSFYIKQIQVWKGSNISKHVNPPPSWHLLTQDDSSALLLMLQKSAALNGRELTEVTEETPWQLFLPQTHLFF